MISIRSPIDPLSHCRSYLSMNNSHHNPNLLSAPVRMMPSVPEIKTENLDVSRRDASNTPGAKRRPSRAGTRSVTTLTAAQLERKRANDREAQRAIRQRTKDHIENLERRITELTDTKDSTAKLADALQRVEDLQRENSMLRSRLSQLSSGSAYTMDSASSAGMSADSSLLSATQSPGGERMTLLHAQQRHSPASTVASIPSVGTQQPTVSQAEGWNTHTRGYSPGSTTPLEAPGSTVDVSAPEMQWSVPAQAPQYHVTGQPASMGAPDNTMHNVDPSVGNQSGYYVVYPSDNRPGYPSSNPSNAGMTNIVHQRTPPPPPAAQSSVQHHQNVPIAQQSDYQQRISSQMGQQQQSYSPFHEQNSYMSGENMQQMMDRPQGQHLMYNIPHMKQEQ